MHDTPRHTILRCAAALIIMAATGMSSGALRSGEIPRDLQRQRIDDLNKRLREQGAKWRAGYVSPFCPTEEESKLLFPPIPPIPEEVRRMVPVIRATGTEVLPLAWDWRELDGVTPVKHQFHPAGCDTCYRYCGSCYAFAACAQLESFIKIHEGRVEDLSEQQIVSCHAEPNPPRGPGGCYGGNAALAYNTFVDPGAVAETCMVYEADDAIPCREHECAIHGRISSWSIVAGDVNSLKLALMSGPVWVSMYSSDNFKYFYRGGSFTYPPGLNQLPNHAMLCVGWNDTLTVCDSTGCETIPSWIVKNSWGEGWGYGGYGYIQYGTPTFASEATQIHYVPGPVTELYLRDPDGGQVWSVGSTHRIVWRSGGAAVDHFEAELLAGGGHVPIDESISPEATELAWTVPGPAAEDCRIRIAAYGAGGEILGEDVSAEPFSILDPRVAWDVSGAAACDVISTQEAPVIACAAGDGAIVVWRDRGGDNRDLDAQKISSGGERLWNPSGVCLSSSRTGQDNQRIAPDGDGGAFVVWEDCRSAAGNGDPFTDIDIYAGWIRSDGIPPSGEYAVCAAQGAQRRPEVASDGAGGVYIVWEDARHGIPDIYAQRIVPGEWTVWTFQGVPVGATPHAETMPQIVPDDAGGAIVVWRDQRWTVDYLYAQRLNPDGTAAWAANGVPVSPAPGIRGACRVVPDGRGGAIVGWTYETASEGAGIQAQRISAAGSVLWPDPGAAVRAAARSPMAFQMAPDGFGGAIFAWDEVSEDWLGEVNHPIDDLPLHVPQRDVFAQRVAADGGLAWAAGGVAVCSLPRSQEQPMITTDGAGGAIVLWLDKRDSRWIDVGEDKIEDDENNWDIFAQRIDAGGNALWRAGGEPVSANLGAQRNATLTIDHGRDIYVAWQDSLAGASRVFAQRLLENASPHRCGVTSSIRRNGTPYPTRSACLSGCPAGDGSDTLVVVCDFFDADMLGVPIVRPSEIELVTDELGFSFCDPTEEGIPGTPENGYRVTLYRHHVKGCTACTTADVSSCADRRANVPVRYGGATVDWVEDLMVRGVDARGDGDVDAIDNEWMGSTFNRRVRERSFNPCYDYDGDGVVNSADLSILGAHYDHACAAAPALSARVEGGAAANIGLTFVIGRTGGPGTLSVTVYLSNVHDLSSMCFGLTNEIPSLAFSGWTSTPQRLAVFPLVPVTRDARRILFFAGYGLEGIDEPLVEIGTLEYNIVGEDTLGDGGAPAWKKRFALLFGDVVDTYGNVGKIAGVECLDASPALENSLWSCYPNPFNPQTTIRYSIEKRGPVTLKIYTVAGEFVRTLVNAVQTPKVGGYEVQWDGRNEAGTDVASGIYFYRLAAGDFSATKKMVLLR